jgi:hypothetical protein
LSSAIEAQIAHLIVDRVEWTKSIAAHITICAPRQSSGKLLREIRWTVSEDDGRSSTSSLVVSLEFKKFSTKFFTDLLFKVLRDCITADDPLYGFCFLGAERAAAVLVTVSKAVELDFFFARSMVVNLMPNHTLARYVVNQLNRMTIAKGIGVAARVALVADASASAVVAIAWCEFQSREWRRAAPLCHLATSSCDIGGAVCARRDNDGKGPRRL